MRIAYITAGAAGMYCGSCLHDNTLAAALLKLGHQASLIPTYTPIRTDEEDVSIDRIFYGGIEVYLQQKSNLFRHRIPRLLDGLLNAPSLLNWLSRFSSSTDAADLGALTVSILRGEQGYQEIELRKLAGWLKEYRPEVVHLTNSLFAGMAAQIKKALGVPVVCGLQGEDIFIEDLIEPYKSQVLQLLEQRSSDVDGFIVPSEYYRDFMSEYLKIPAGKIEVVPLGLNLSGHGSWQKNLDPNTFTIGYLARICPEKGLHLLVEAFRLLAENNGVRLKVAGYLGKKNEAYLKELIEKLSDLKDRFEHVGEVNREEKLSFLNSVDVLCVPTVYREPKALFAYEAMANGVPVVAPDHGAFPEILRFTGGGILVEPNSAKAVADGILRLMKNPEERRKLGEIGKKQVHAYRGDIEMARATVAVYQKYLGK